MKNRRFVSLVLMAAMLLPALIGVGPVLAAGPSNWAVPEMNDANMQGLLTPSAARDFRKDLTRDEFCEIVVEMVERVRGEALPVPAVNPFKDTNSVHVLKAYQYGITTGTSDTTFSPERPLQRQQLCAMMLRAIQGLESELGRTLLNPPIQTLPYADSSRVSSYANLAVRYAYTNEIMRGGSLNRFNPVNPITSEECVATSIRSFNRMETVLAPLRTASQNLDITEERLNIGYAFGDTQDGVTQNIMLPTRGSGGAVISWVSSNTSIIGVGGVLYDIGGVEIGRTGVVNVGNTAQNVTLTATITLGNQTRTQEFVLRTSTFSGDRLLFENAYNALDIIYINQGDSASSVTGRIGLPDKVLDVPVTWSTSNPNVVALSGEVSVPTGSEVRSATLTATIRVGSFTQTKTFNLTIVNPQFNRSVSLHGIEFGMNQSRVTQLLGTVRKTIQTSSTESWQLYHANNNYTDFIAVAFISNRAVAVYSMAGNAANQLKNNAGVVITVAQADAVSGVSAVSYSDVTQQFAIMIYESNSVIGSPRTLTAERQGELLFELVNAYRVRNSRSALEWTERLATPARQHSEWNRGSAPTIGTGANALSARASTAGFTTTGTNQLYGGGNVMAGQNDAFGFIRDMASTAAMRNEILSATATLFGAGFASAASGTYRTYMSYMLGNVRFITNVTTAQATGTPATIRITGLNAAMSVTLVPAYTSLITTAALNETYTVTSSNTARMTATATSAANVFSLTGISQGDANLTITGNLSGKTYNIPVNVGTGYASGLQLTYQAPDGSGLSNTPLMTTAQTTNTSASNTSSITLIVGTNETLNLAAVATATSGTPAVSWSRSTSSGTEIVGTNGSTYAFKPSEPGNITLTASVPRSAGVNTTHTVKVIVLSEQQITVSPQTQNISIGGTPASLTANVSNIPTTPASAYSWSHTGSSISPASASQSTNTASYNAVSEGTSTVSFTATWTPTASGHHLGRVTRTASVTVQGALYATSLTLSPTGTVYLVHAEGLTRQITALTNPAQVVSSVEWSSDNSSVATVNNGLVTPFFVGNATITATIAKSATEQHTATVDVIVLAPVTIAQGATEVSVGNTVQQLVSNDITSYSGVTMKWESEKPAIAEFIAPDGMLRANTEGSTEITVSLWQDDVFLYRSPPVTITVSASAP